MLKVQSTRFGSFEVPDEAVIEFPNGILGLSGRKWTLVARDPDSDFLWLHSLEDPSLALPVTNPWLFFPDYAVEIDEGDAKRIGITKPEDADVYVTVRAAESLEDFRANLRAPILVHAGQAHQIINQIPEPVQAPMFTVIEETVDAVEPTLETSVG
jgi:flagellar assembly factor FliW